MLVTDGSSVAVAVGGSSVGMVKACLVGGRVEVTKRGAAGVGVSCSSVDTFRQEDKVKVMRMNIQNFFIGGL